MVDRYTKTVLTVIAGALVYLCVVMTAFPSVQAQASLRPGEPTGPQDVRIVEWRSTAPMPVVAREPLRVVTERSTGVADRVILVGWEENGQPAAPGAMRRFDSQNPGLPVIPTARP
jgi:hypothetical protein